MSGKFSFYKKGIKNKIPSSTMTLDKAIALIRSDEYKESVTMLRAATNKSVRKVLKNALDYFTFSGTFKERLAEKLIQHSAIICIDFDNLADVEFEKQLFAKDRYTLAVFCSPSGNGLKVLVEITPEQHLESFLFLEEYYKRKYFLEIDASGKDVNRACFVSHDPEAFYNPDARALRLYDSIEIPQKEEPNQQPKNSNAVNAVRPEKLKSEQQKNLKRAKFVADQIQNHTIDITSDYDEWNLIGFSLATLGEDARTIFHKVSQFHPEYTEASANEKFDNAVKTTRFKNPAKFFSIAKDYGLDVRLPKEVTENKKQEELYRELPDGIDPDDYDKYSFYEYKGKYWSIGGRGPYEVSNFVMRILFHVETSDDLAFRLIELKNEHGYKVVINLNTDDFTAVGSFKKAVARKGNFLFKGNDVDLIRLQDKLQREERPTNLVKTLGYNKRGDFYAFANGIFDCKKEGAEAEDAFLPIDEYGIVEHEAEVKSKEKEGEIVLRKQNYFIPALSKVFAEKDDLYANEKKFIFKNGGVTFEAWSKQYCTVYGDNGKFALVFYTMSLFSDLIFKALGRRFPILNASGKKGSGKGACVQSLLRAFGEGQDQIMLGGASTVVGFMRKFAQFTNAIVWLDEYKNNLKAFFIESLKNIYDRIGYERGKKDNSFSTESTPISSACILSGQEMPTIEPALFSRVILLMFSETKRTEEQRIEFKKLKDMEDAGLSSITVSLLKHRKHFKSQFEIVYNDAFKKFITDVNNAEVDERILSNYAAFIATARIICKLETTPFTADEFAVLSKDYAIRQFFVLRGSDDVSKFWDVVESLFNQSLIKEGSDFELRNGSLYLRLQNVYPHYAKELRQRNDPNVLDKSTLENYLETDTRSFIRKAKKSFSDGSYTWCVEVKYKEININLIRITDQTLRKAKFLEMGIEEEVSNDQDIKVFTEAPEGELKF